MAKPPLRERLLGLLVILCIALIFYPLIFTSEDQFRIDRNTQIPQRPAMNLSTEAVRPQAPVELEPVNPNLFVPGEDNVVLDNASDDPLSGQGLPNSELIQVGSFASVNNANDLVARLLDAGFKAYSRLAPSSDGAPDLHKVYVGPYMDKSRADEAEALLRDNLGLQPIRLKFEP